MWIAGCRVWELHFNSIHPYTFAINSEKSRCKEKMRKKTALNSMIQIIINLEKCHRPDAQYAWFRVLCIQIWNVKSLINWKKKAIQKEDKPNGNMCTALKFSRYNRNKNPNICCWFCCASLFETTITLLPFLFDFPVYVFFKFYFHQNICAFSIFQLELMWFTWVSYSVNILNLNFNAIFRAYMYSVDPFESNIIF